jgi:hypothetical protein
MDFFYGYLGNDVSIIIADDSQNPEMPKVKVPFNIKHIPLPFDTGLSYGRNVMLDHTETLYFILLDDDFVFTGATKIEYFLDLMQNNPDLDILAGEVYNNGKRKVRSNCCITFIEGKLTKYKKPYKVIGKLNYYDFVVNFFIAKTAVIKQIRWDDELKIVEHTAFFLKAKESNLTCAETSLVKINHFRPKIEHYKKFRKDRIDEFMNILKTKYQIKEIIEM